MLVNTTITFVRMDSYTVYVQKSLCKLFTKMKRPSFGRKTPSIGKKVSKLLERTDI